MLTFRTNVMIAMIAGLFASHGLAAEAKKLFDPGADNVALKAESAQLTYKREMTGTDTGLGVTIAAGESNYPGLSITPADGSVWDLSAFGHVEAQIINTGNTPLGLSMRIDDNGDWKSNPFNAEAKTIKPGEAGTVKVIFGYAYGFKPGYKLDSSKVSKVLLFTGKTNKQPATFQIVSVVAGGVPGETPPVKAEDVRVKPKDGVILGRGTTFDVEKQITAKGVTAAACDDGVQLTFSGEKGQTATIKSAAGRWDLRDAIQVTVMVKNSGTAPVQPRVRVESNGGPSQWATVDAPIAPGHVKAITVSFINGDIWEGPTELKGRNISGKQNTGNRVGSDVVSGVNITADAEAFLLVQSVVAEAPVAELPDWIGKRPPTEGDWSLTFEDNFDGNAIDTNRWRIYTENYWDKTSHFTKDNVVVENGIAKLRYEKKRGHANDDPVQKETDYAVGYLDTYGKWTQRYGYFEARIKRPTAPGLWPAFWLMPDRGEKAGEQWKRSDTKDGGMEFDIYEPLTRWGPHRYNIAFHWDGYGKDHKASGIERIYTAVDKDGFITAGLLWLPGKAVYYANGIEVARWENDRISNVRSYPIFDMVSGGWDNDAVDDSKLPADFQIDYIRIWQRKDLASEAESPASPPSAKK